MFFEYANQQRALNWIDKSTVFVVSAGSDVNKTSFISI
jgi:hypothetical protein